MSRPRVGIVGGRRRRQGLGPFVARFLKEAGAEVAGVVGTRRETLEAAVGLLKRDHGIETRGYLSLGALLSAEAPDALAILSPSETHRHYLEAALEARLPVLCEKPLIWGEPSPAPTAERIVGGFLERGLALRENCPWPYTLPAYARLHPGPAAGEARRFEMLLSPVSTGVQMLADAMPHALSLLQAIAPAADAALRDVRYSTRAVDAREIRAAFRYAAAGREIEAEVRLAQQAGQPRDAGYGLDGRWARRTIRMEDYAIFFSDGARRVEVPDPLGLLVADFVRDLRGAAPADNERRGREIAQRARLLDALVRTYADPATDAKRGE